MKMKKLLLILVALLCTVSVYTQTEKGRMFVGGYLNLSTSSQASNDTLNNDKYSSFGFQINPGFGYFIKNNIAIGGNLNFGIDNSSQDFEYSGLMPNTTTYKNNNLTIGADIYAQFYKKIVPNFFVFITGSVDYMHEAQKVESSNSNPNYTNPYPIQHHQVNDITISIFPGLVYFITPKLGIQTSFGNLHYTYSMNKNTTLTYDHSSSSTFGLSFRPSSFSFGMNYYF